MGEYTFSWGGDPVRARRGLSTRPPKILPYCLLHGKTRKNLKYSRSAAGFCPVSACAGRFFRLKPHILLQNHLLSASVCAVLCFSGGILQYPLRFHRKYRKNRIYPPARISENAY